VAIRIDPVSTQIKNDGHDTAILNFCAVDYHGRMVPTADDLLHFEVLGDGILKGVGNGDPNSHEPDNVPYRKLFAGLCQALVMSKPGAKSITVRASADGLEGAEVTLDVAQVEQPDYIFPCENHEIYSFTMSEISKDRLDPLVQLSDNDMNSFVPIRFQMGHYQVDYFSGWRIYRTVFTPPAAGCYTMTVGSVFAEDLEIWVGGKCCCKESKLHHRRLTCRFAADAPVEVRILTNVRTDDPNGAGLSQWVQIKKES